MYGKDAKYGNDERGMNEVEQSLIERAVAGPIWNQLRMSIITTYKLFNELYNHIIQMIINRFKFGKPEKYALKIFQSFSSTMKISRISVPEALC